MLANRTVNNATGLAIVMEGRGMFYSYIYTITVSKVLKCMRCIELITHCTDFMWSLVTVQGHLFTKIISNPSIVSFMSVLCYLNMNNNLRRIVSVRSLETSTMYT